MCDTISSGDDWGRIQMKAKNSHQTLGVLLFAQWHQPSLQLSKVFDGLQEDNPTIVLCKADADVVPDLTRMFKVDSVPTVVFLQSGKEVARIEGADVPRVVQAVERLASSYKAPAVAASSDADGSTLQNRLKRLVQAHRIMVFLRGSPDAPGCQSSRQIVEYLKEVNAEFDYFDILLDEEVHQGLQALSDCKLFPQLYVGGEFVGSIDVVKALFEDRKLKERLGVDLSPNETPAVPLEDRLKSLISQHKVMLFMKGSPDEPRCGFSRTIVQLLSGYQIGDFGHFDILTDNEVRQGLKTFSNWKTYPQLYVNGELLGGLDIIKELHEDGELEGMLAA